MVRGWAGRLAAKILFAALLAAAASTVALAQNADNVIALNKQAEQLYSQGKTSEATEIAGKALAAGERALGPDHPATLLAVNNLAFLYRMQRRYGDAEPRSGTSSQTRI